MARVSLSNKLDSEVIGRKPSKRPHREVVGAAIVDSELLGKVIQRVKAVGGIKAFLVLPVTALHFSVMAWCIRADELMADAQLGSGRLKQSRQVTPAVGKAVDVYKRQVKLRNIKQKTAYEMRISDWSSDVCSSDLERQGRGCGFFQRFFVSRGLTKRFNGCIIIKRHKITRK